MKVKVSELEGGALDWTVSLAIYPKSYISGDRLRVRADIDGEEETIASVFLGSPRGMMREFKPSTDWGQGGPLIESSGVWLTDDGVDGGWVASMGGVDLQEGPTPLIAACRAIVGAKFGDSVEVPDEFYS